ncbi:MAG: tRNA (adenosine(37)-N6)-threonylcarbamoyltransferase complex transferase subunit TsaD [Candidatus Nealsonbacteria bacterium]
MKILAIETSCDDTCAAVIEAKNKKFNIFSNVISSQVEIHKKWGGVYPTLARREHQKNLVPVLIKALKKANLLNKKRKEKIKSLKKILERENVLLLKLREFLERYKKPKIDAIAITSGPGLEPSLWTGVNLAKALSFYWNIPLIPVNHIEGHIMANFIENQNIPFPTVCLVASGGHTQLVLMKKFKKYKVLGETRDDAAGECFDKTAKILGLEYPGGPLISKLAKKQKPPFIDLPRPMIKQKNYDFSFSGLKTAVLYYHKKQSEKTKKSEKYIKKMAASIEKAVIEVLLAKTLKAAESQKAKSVLLCGGVAANEKLREEFKSKLKKGNIKFFVPEKILCTDNAAMIGAASYLNRKKPWQKIEAESNLRL